jgi:hypothetical protein
MFLFDILGYLTPILGHDCEPLESLDGNEFQFEARPLSPEIPGCLLVIYILTI